MNNVISYHVIPKAMELTKKYQLFDNYIVFLYSIAGIKKICSYKLKLKLKLNQGGCHCLS